MTLEKLRAYCPNKFTVLQGENFPPRLIRSSKSENIPGQFCPVPADITLPPDKQGTSRAFFYSQEHIRLYTLDPSIIAVGANFYCSRIFISKLHLNLPLNFRLDGISHPPD